MDGEILMREILINNIGDNTQFYDVYGIFQIWNKKSTYSYMANPRPNHGFMCVLCHSITIISNNGNREVFRRGDILYLPKGYSYFVEFYDDKSEFNTLLINFNMRDSLGDDIVFYKKVTRLVSSASARYTDIFLRIINRYRSDVNSYFSLMSDFYGLLDILARHIGKKRLLNNEYKIIAPAIIYIDSHINENTTVAELAKMCLVSETCFRRYFGICMGMNPSRYKIKTKIKKAKQMLGTGDMSANDIAAELGFYDLPYFYKVFKKETGITPAQYVDELIT